METIIDIVTHPEKFNGIFIFLLLLVWLLFWSLFVGVIIFVEWKGKKIGTGTALYIGLGYGGLVFMLTVLIDIGWLLLHWHQSMSWIVLFPHFLAILIALLWTSIFPYRRVREDLNDVGRRLKNYSERRKEYDKAS
jgi:hypothetical protein